MRGISYLCHVIFLQVIAAVNYRSHHIGLFYFFQMLLPVIIETIDLTRSQHLYDLESYFISSLSLLFAVNKVGDNKIGRAPILLLY